MCSTKIIIKNTAALIFHRCGVFFKMLTLGRFSEPGQGTPCPYIPSNLTAILKHRGQTPLFHFLWLNRNFETSGSDPIVSFSLA